MRIWTVAAGIGLGLVVAFDVWLFRRLAAGSRAAELPAAPAVDWTDPDFAPPAFECGPHDFERASHTACCSLCGGGRLHDVHPNESARLGLAGLAPADPLSTESLGVNP